MYRLLVGCIALLSVHDGSFITTPPPLPNGIFLDTLSSTARSPNGAQDASTSVNNLESGCPCLSSVNGMTIPGQSDWLTQRQQHLEQPYTRNVLVHGTMCTCNIGLKGTPVRDDYHYTAGIGAHKLHTRAVTWNDARKVCNEEGGHLAIINSVYEAHVSTRPGIDARVRCPTFRLLHSLSSPDPRDISFSSPPAFSGQPGKKAEEGTLFSYIFTSLIEIQLMPS